MMPAALACSLRLRYAVAAYEAGKPAYWRGMTTHEQMMVQMYVSRNRCPS
jgi:hypothetical protein